MLRQFSLERKFGENLKVFLLLIFCSVGYIEIFNEVLYDLLNRRQTVHIGRHNGSDIKLSNKEVIVSEKKTIFKLLQKGNNAKTPIPSSDATSVSHTIFRIVSGHESSFSVTIP